MESNRRLHRLVFCRSVILCGPFGPQGFFICSVNRPPRDFFYQDYSLARLTNLLCRLFARTQSKNADRREVAMNTPVIAVIIAVALIAGCARHHEQSLQPSGFVRPHFDFAASLTMAGELGYDPVYCQVPEATCISVQLHALWEYCGSRSRTCQAKQP